ncbi:MAG: 30S ribosomal protein S16 [Ignavibacteria bacterium]|nr:30S ribosomal protein S16 [Ignavibacteria bacterium]
MGKRHYPIYKIVAADSRFPRDGRFIEAVGSYNPNLDPMEVILKEERVKYWLNVGAQPTDTVRNLLQNEGLILKRNLEKRGVASETVETEFQKFLAEKESKIKRAKEKKVRRKLKKKTKKDTKDSPEAKTGDSSAEPKAEEVKTEETPKAETPKDPKVETLKLKLHLLRHQKLKHHRLRENKRLVF